MSSPAHPLPTKRWVLPLPDPAARQLAEELRVSPLIGDLLWQRGLHDATTAGTFLEPRLQDLGDPFLLTDLRKAAERLAVALTGQERMVIFGDYDVDGITSSALLWRVLRVLGGKVHTFLPNRLTEGYGLSQVALERCLTELRPQLLIAVDCGTTAVAEIGWLRTQGIDVLVVDHHELPSALPPCVALVNPHRDGRYEYLASVGLVFKLCHGLLKAQPAYRERLDLRDYLDLVAVGTVADIVPLREDNRIYVSNGLRLLERTKNPGLQALRTVAGIRRTPRADDIGFRLGPRLNASGRLDDANESLRLLTTDDSDEAMRLARSLDEKNKARQQLEARIYDEALVVLAAHFHAEEDWAIILGQRGWHTGVIGIVAARLQRLYHRPTIIIGFDEDGAGKGSGRSIEGCCLVDGLRAAQGCLDKFGGHEMAAGLSMQESALGEFQQLFQAWVKRTIRVEQLQPRLALSGNLAVDQVNEELFHDLEQLAPFGRENPQPIFAFREIRQRRPPQTIKKHVKLFLQGGEENCLAIGFGFAERPMPEGSFSIAGSVEWDDFQNGVQIRMVDWQAAAA